MDHVKIDPKLTKANWGTEPDAQINIVPAWRFFNQWNTVTDVKPSEGRIDIADSERHGSIKGGNWFWVEGVKEELDQPVGFATRARPLGAQGPGRVQRALHRQGSNPT
jgi:hypothetical protein